jgi:hypothetical protein
MANSAIVGNPESVSYRFQEAVAGSNPTLTAIIFIFESVAQKIALENS